MTLNYRKITFYDGNSSLSQEVDELAQVVASTLRVFTEWSDFRFDP